MATGHDLAALDRATEDPNHNPIGPESLTVINDWQLVHIDHNNHGERELALANTERSSHLTNVDVVEAAPVPTVRVPTTRHGPGRRYKARFVGPEGVCGHRGTSGAN